MSRRLLLVALSLLLLPWAASAQPVLTLSSASMDWNNTTPVRVTVSGLTAAETHLRLYVDADQSGTLNTGDYLVWSDVGRDNVSEWSPVMFSDQAPALGTVALDLGAVSPFRFPHTAGRFLFQAQDGSGGGLSSAVPFTVTPVASTLQVSGQVLDEDLAGVAGAVVVLVPLGNNGFEGFGEDWERWGPSCVADPSGNFTLNVPSSMLEAGACTQRLVVPIKPGYMSQLLVQPSQPLVTLGVSATGLTPRLRLAGSGTAAGTITYSSGAKIGQGIPGAMVFGVSLDGPPEFTVAMTDTNGVYSMPLSAHAFNNSGRFAVNCWDPLYLAFQGAVGRDDYGTTVTLSGSLTGNLTFPAADAFIQGTLRNPSNLALGAGYLVHAKDTRFATTPGDRSDDFRANGLTGATGNFTLGVVGGTVSTPTTHVVLLNRAYIPDGLLAYASTCTPGYTGQTTGQDIHLESPTAWLSGHVQDPAGTPRGDLSIRGTYSPSSCQMVNSRAFTSCADGSYSLPTAPGTWTVEVSPGDLQGGYNNVEQHTISKSVTLTGSLGGGDFILGCWPIRPALTEISPPMGYEGARVWLHGTGFSLGSMPTVTWTDRSTNPATAYPAAILAYYPDLGDLYVMPPPVSGVTPYSRYEVVVTNNDLGLDSAPLCYTIQGPAPSGCILQGTVTDGGGAVQNAVVRVSDDARAMRGMDFTDATGHYSITLPGPASTYRVAIYPPPSATLSTYRSYTPGFYTGVSCAGTRDHVFDPGKVVQGRIFDSHGDGVTYAQVDVVSSSGSVTRALADMEGNYTLRAPATAGTTLRFLGPPTSRYISQMVSGEDFSTLPGPFTYDRTLAQGVVLVGNTVTYGLQNNPALSAPTGTMVAAPRSIEAWRTSDNTFLGRSNWGRAETCDGRFSVAVAGGTEFHLRLGDPDPAKARTDVHDFTLTWDTFAEFPIPVYDGGGPATPEPRFGRDLKTHGQVGAPVDVWGENLAADSVAWFKDEVGEYLEGTTSVDPDRGLLITRVPVGAATTYMDVDRTVGPVYFVSRSFPFAIDAGTFNAGPHSITGTVTGTGGVPVQNAIVALIAGGFNGCGDSTGNLHDVSVTGPSGAYSLTSLAGDIGVIVFPPAGSGLAGAVYQQTGLAGNLVHNFPLATASSVTVNVTDGANPVQNARVSFMQEASGFLDTRLTNASGVASLPLPAGTYHVEVLSPEKDRFVEWTGTYTMPGSALNVTLTRGRMATACAVDPTGSPVSISEGQTQHISSPDTEYGFGFTREEGWVSLQVPPSTAFGWNLRPREDRLANYYTQKAGISVDTVWHPSLLLSPAGVFAGTVTQYGTTTPLADIPVRVFSGANPTITLANTSTCPDGTYRIKTRTGSDYLVSFNEGTTGTNASYATEYYNEVFCMSAATPLTITEGATITANDALNLLGEVWGSVYAGATNTQIAGATVTASGAVLGACGPATETTLSDGSYSMNLPLGSYTMTAADTLGSNPTQYWDHVSTLSRATAVGVTAGSPSRIDFDLGTVPAGQIPSTGSAALRIAKGSGADLGKIKVTFGTQSDARAYNLYAWNGYRTTVAPVGVYCHLVPGVTPGFVDNGNGTATYTFTPGATEKSYIASASNTVGEGSLGYATSGERDATPSIWRCWNSPRP